MGPPAKKPSLLPPKTHRSDSQIRRQAVAFLIPSQPPVLCFAFRKIALHLITHENWPKSLTVGGKKLAEGEIRGLRPDKREGGSGLILAHRLGKERPMPLSNFLICRGDANEVSAALSHSWQSFATPFRLFLSQRRRECFVSPGLAIPRGFSRINHGPIATPSAAQIRRCPGS
jgi:hypothetical protein